MDALSSLGTFFSSGAGQGLTKIGELGAAGAGEVGNLLNNRERNQELNYVKQQQATLANPTQLAQQVAAATQPLSQGLTEAVGNQVSGTLAEQGLAQAPGIQATALAQALAPAELTEQQNALQLVMQRLNLPPQYAQTLLAGLPPNTNLAPLLALLQNKGTAGAGTPNIAAILNLIRSSNGPQNQPTTQSTLPNTLDSTGTDYNFAPGATWIPPAISDLPSSAPSFGG